MKRTDDLHRPIGWDVAIGVGEQRCGKPPGRGPAAGTETAGHQVVVGLRVFKIRLRRYLDLGGMRKFRGAERGRASRANGCQTHCAMLKGTSDI